MYSCAVVHIILEHFEKGESVIIRGVVSLGVVVGGGGIRHEGIGYYVGNCARQVVQLLWLGQGTMDLWLGGLLCRGCIL